MRGEGFIDLGEVSEAEAEADREIRRPQWRPPAVAIAPLLVLCVLAMVAAPAPRSRVVQIAEVVGTELGFMLVQGGLLRQVGDEMLLVGADGRERWRIPWVARPDDFARASSVNGRVLIRTTNRHDEMLTVALDVATGERKWELPGWVHSLGDMLLHLDEALLRIYDADAARMLWESTGHRTVGFDLENRTAFVFGRDQRLSEHDMRTGAMLRSRQLPVPGELDSTHIEVFTDHVLLAGVSSVGRREEIALFDRRTLQPIDESAARWHRRLDCGAVVECVVHYGPGTGGGVVERATGRLLWSVPQGQVTAPWNDGNVIILGFTDWAGEYRVIDVVEPLTRRSIMGVAGGTLLSDTGELDLGRIRATQIALFRAKGRPTLVARVGVAGIRVLGSVPEKVDSCQYIAPLLQCRTEGNASGVWRIDE